MSNNLEEFKTWLAEKLREKKKSMKAWNSKSKMLIVFISPTKNQLESHPRNPRLFWYHGRWVVFMIFIGFHVCLNVSCGLDFIFRILGSLLYCWGKVAQDKKTKKKKISCFWRCGFVLRSCYFVMIKII